MTSQFHTCCQSNAIKKKKTLLHFSQVLLCSLAPLLPHIFSCLPRSSRLSLPLSPSVSSLCPSACLSHSAAAVSILYSVCYFWMKLSSRAASLWASLEARPQLADCGCMVAMLIHSETLQLAPERERERNRKRGDRKTYSGTVEINIATDILWHSNKD